MNPQAKAQLLTWLPVILFGLVLFLIAKRGAARGWELATPCRWPPRSSSCRLARQTNETPERYWPRHIPSHASLTPLMSKMRCGSTS